MVFSIVMVLLVGSAALAGALYVTRDKGPSHPDEWDPRIEPIAEFVERERGLGFDQPVYVDFLTPDEYRDRITGEEVRPEATAEDDAASEQYVAMLRTMGLVSGTFDAEQAGDDVADAGTLAFYSPEEERIVVRGTELTDPLKVTLAHELTHALQDQAIGLEVFGTLAGTADTRARAVVEGDAMRVEDAFVQEEFTAEEREALGRDEADAAEEATQTLEDQDVPEALLTFLQVPYVFGPGFVGLVEAEKGNEGVDAALAEFPTSMEQVWDPMRYLADDQPLEVAPVPLPEGAEEIDRDEFGSVNWFLVLAERVNPKTALAAVDGWGGDEALFYELDGKVCMTARVKGDTEADGAQFEVAAAQWRDAMPSETTVERDGDTVDFSTCDPGVDAEFPVEGMGAEALALPVVRTQILTEAVEGGVPMLKARCYADRVIAGLDLAQLTSDTVTPEITAVIQEAQRACA